jgi:hypothetical protein
MPTSISRQRRYQIRRKRKKLCETCGRIVFKGGECRRHWVARQMRRLLGVEKADAATQRVLQMMWSVESRGLRFEEDFKPSIKMQRWLNRWLPRVGDM